MRDYQKPMSQTFFPRVQMRLTRTLIILRSKEAYVTSY